MVRLIDYGVSKIAVLSVDSTTEELSIIKDSVNAVGGLYSKSLGYYISSESITRLTSLLTKNGVTVELDESVTEIMEATISNVSTRLNNFEKFLPVFRTFLKEKYSMDLFPHQISGARWLNQKNKAILADDPGVGKTLTAITAIPEGSAVLVEAPAMAIGVWKEHFLKYRPEFKITIIKSSEKFKVPAYNEVVICSRGNVPPTVKEIQQIQEGKRKGKSKKLEAVTVNAHSREILPYTILIADEAHQFKSAGTVQTQKHRILMKEVLRRNGFVWMITGTPLVNRPPDLWGVLQSVSCASEVFGGWFEFTKLFGAKPGPFGGYFWPEKIKDIDSVASVVREKLSTVMIRRTFDQVRPDLPEKRRSIFTIPFDQVKDRNTWKELDEAMSALESAGLTIDDMLKLLNAGKMSKLPINPFTLRKILSTAKIPALLEFVKEAEELEEPLIVAAAHTAPLDALRKRKGWAIIDGSVPALLRKSIEEDFQNGKLLGVGLSIEAGGMSLSLHRAHRMVFVDLEWTPGQNTQMEDRIRRIKQDKGCLYTILCLDHPYEFKVLTSLINKAKLIDKTINSLAGKEISYRVDELNSFILSIEKNKLLFDKFNVVDWGELETAVRPILSKGFESLSEAEWYFIKNLGIHNNLVA